MKIIRTQDRESIGSSRNGKRLDCRLGCIVPLIVLLALVGALFIDNLFYPPSNYKRYDSSDQIIDLLENNKEEFNEVMGIIDETEAFLNRFRDGKDNKASNSWSIKKYVTKDEYKIIKNFWDAYQPYYMGHTWMDFQINEGRCVYLFYNMDSMKSYYSQSGTITQIDDNWYMVEYCD